MKHDTDDIYRLYVREWVIIHTLHGQLDHNVIPPAKPLYDKAVQWVRDNLGGRVRDEDVQFELHTDNITSVWAHVKLYKDNLKGEYKAHSAALLTASIKDYDEYTIVPRNSPADHEIRSYGVAKL